MHDRRMDDADSKRLSLLVPKELFDRFLDLSQSDLMASYVKAKEVENERIRYEAVLTVYKKCGEMLYKPECRPE